MADTKEVRALKRQVKETQAALEVLPKWTEAWQSKAYLLESQSQRLDELTKPSDDLSVSPPPLEYDKTDPQSELAAIDKRLGIIGDGELNEVYTGHRQELRARKAHIEERMPYLSVSSDDLTAQVEDAQIALEQLTTELRGLPPLQGTTTDSPTTKKTVRLQAEAGERLARLQNELAHRRTREEVASAVSFSALEQAKDIAAQTWAESYARQVKEMTAAGAPQSELLALKEERGGKPPPEKLVNDLKESIEADFIAEHPTADMSRPI